MTASDHLNGQQFEDVDHILSAYRPSDGKDWDEVESNYRWEHPKNREFVADVRKNGVQRPVPIDYDETPPVVKNGHTRILAAKRAGQRRVPVRQWEMLFDPDDMEEGS